MPAAGAIRNLLFCAIGQMHPPINKNAIKTKETFIRDINALNTNQIIDKYLDAYPLM